MANTQGMASSFKSEVMSGIHALGTSVIRAATTPDTLKGALFLVTATVNVSNTGYTTTGEATGAGYTAGGVAVTNANAPTTSGTAGIWTPSGSLVYSGVTVGPVDCVQIYNSTQGNKAISVHTFGAQTVTAGTLTLTMPTNAPGTALLQIS